MNGCEGAHQTPWYKTSSITNLLYLSPSAMPCLTSSFDVHLRWEALHIGHTSQSLEHVYERDACVPLVVLDLINDAHPAWDVKGFRILSQPLMLVSCIIPTCSIQRPE